MSKIILGALIGAVTVALLARTCGGPFVPPDIAARADSFVTTRETHDSAISAFSQAIRSRDSARAATLRASDSTRKLGDSLKTTRQKLAAALNLPPSRPQGPRSPLPGDTRVDSLEILAQTAILESETRQREADSLRSVVGQDSLTKMDLREALRLESERRLGLEAQNLELVRLSKKRVGGRRLSVGPFGGLCTTGKACGGIGVTYALF